MNNSILVHDEEGSNIRITADCLECKTCYSFLINTTGYFAWRAGALIQNVLPTLSIDYKELLISGVCGRCFDKIFDGEEAE